MAHTEKILRQMFRKNQHNNRNKTNLKKIQTKTNARLI